MKFNCTKHINLSAIMRISILILSVLCSLNLKAQVNPPRPMTLTVSPVQSLDFGKFCLTGPNGGTITITNTGNRTFTGDIMLIGNNYSYGVFSVQVASGTPLFMLNNPVATLTGSNGGQMQITLGPTYPALPLTTISGITSFNMGATLTIGPASSNPPGEYSGTYEFIINHE